MIWALQRNPWVGSASLMMANRGILGREGSRILQIEPIGFSLTHLDPLLEARRA
ncbi:hypothetical protein Poly30_29410 [Planctomycetes bacterium Poly30]|uniref:Uncharacterized protein n=1 Tax=Saltatorellus ferox TaxID=2528018 RepID=A0A518ETJ4_9BACT|nr:hypothetical protein Poly30_29410 [Planctomycetes bacterium Poly30]